MGRGKMTSDNYEEPEFYGPGFDPDKDAERLRSKKDQIKSIMLDEKWHTLRELSGSTDTPEASVSAHIRCFRRKSHGGHIVDRRRVKNYYEYRLNAKTKEDADVV
jgi:hypothetical protein